MMIQRITVSIYNIFLHFALFGDEANAPSRTDMVTKFRLRLGAFIRVPNYSITCLDRVSIETNTHARIEKAMKFQFILTPH